jgi:DNA-directed RNA polymerase specialized sigma24 family protein
MDVDEHLFRREAGRIVSALTRIFGVHNLALAEDVVQDAFCRALEVWHIRGVPDNPSAWLMTTARNRALDVLRRQRTANRPPRFLLSSPIILSPRLGPAVAIAAADPLSVTLGGLDLVIAGACCGQRHDADGRGEVIVDPVAQFLQQDSFLPQ